MGDWARFLVGWLYWYFWVIVLAVEAAAGAAIIQEWLPGVPIWASSLVLMIALTATNLVSVRAFGEFEFWFASIKVVAILAFIAIALVYVIADGVSRADGRRRLRAQGRRRDPVRHRDRDLRLRRRRDRHDRRGGVQRARRGGHAATNSVIVRVLTFYVLSIFLIVAILPWNSAELGKSPFAAALGEIGFPAAEQVMNAVVLTAVLSCLNSGLYVASRMNFALARTGDAPQWMVRLNGRGVPARAILIATSIGFLSVIANVISPEKVFLFLLNSSGAVALFVYLLIAVSQLVLRRRLEGEDPDRFEVRMWLYPVPDVVHDRRDRRRDRVDGVRVRRPLAALSRPAERRRRARGLLAEVARRGAGRPAGRAPFTREDERERSATLG